MGLRISGGGSGAIVAWAANTSYKAGQAVTHGGRTYIATAAFTSSSTFNFTNWTRVTTQQALTRMEFYGHSWCLATANISNNGQHRYSKRLAAVYGLTEVNNGVGGAKLALDDASANGGWYKVQSTFLPGQRDPLGSNLGSALQVASLNYGLNDTSSTAAERTMFGHALRASICHLRASQRYPANSTLVTRTGGFAGGGALTGVAVNSFIAGTGLNTNTLTVTLPSTFPGGEVCFYFVSQDTNGGIVTAQVDGGTGIALDARTLSDVAGRYVSSVLRVPSISAGTHTLLVTASSISGAGIYFAGHSIQATNPPLIVVHNVARVPLSGNVTSPLNAIISSVCAEFDAQVVYYDSDATLFPVQSSSIGADNQHPTEYGHRLIAQDMYTIIENASIPAITNALDS